MAEQIIEIDEDGVPTCSLCGQNHGLTSDCDFQKQITQLKADLAAAYAAGWDEAVEAADKAVVESGIPYGWQSTLCHKIRRLKKGQGV